MTRIGHSFRRALSAGLTVGLASPAPADDDGSASIERAKHLCVGMWHTDGHDVRHELLPNGRYDEARGMRESAYQGRYEVEGDYIRYWDDTGFTADGTFVETDTLHHGGMILRRQK